ncbi:FG-GAP repeat domain-containing protein [Pseudoalteromonas luteoviolacea]|uniref:Cadherin domain-containing protein n=1 Tax=Pseudoalteromonas luteoviolacea S4054 TaxID=1129367 RepID=A0A0F6AER6_9GAMM|nr:VCBS repeat-containing protein [Pseudoalteromonas luteoviolacea]AOT08184.1 hypothetical protein S4054249_10160 [Pseudoalteromonas luteoviolacea]AOT13101.1 hypothetical protein S40542_10160 [Pseudoalteromonas luteoviolacea]AOT18013.1 hypothetical protein S4054_10155 [Pseudoalteromonas luteoviolacea]KKE84712.1 hypothetical protein N479_07910 [Pseudoalteromonas luteoviolacea S4054]KZN74407.1 hypothetical protein N481_00740 [Pseudoalteromonas luteoviolacea S4047-1]
MIKFKQSSIAFALSLVLAGCGGGSDSPSKESVASETLTNPKGKTFSELDTAANSLLKSRYTGLDNNSEINLELVQKTVTHLLDDSASSFTDFDFPGIQNHIKSNGSIEGTERCDNGGTVIYSGSASESGSGIISAKFINCANYDYATITGNITVKSSVETNEIGIYFDALEMSDRREQQKLTGSFKATQTDTVYVTQNILLEDKNGSQVVSQLSVEGLKYDDGYNQSLSLSGTVKFGDSGIVTVDATDLKGYSPSFLEGDIKISGINSSATISFNDTYPVFYQDVDLDNENDLGAYIMSIRDYVAGNYTDLNPVPLNILSLPPSVSSPYFYGNSPDTTMPITVEGGSYSDPDTAIEDLVVSFEWYVNDELVEGQYTNTLPAGVAVFGDVLEVAMKVSDGANSVLSYRTSITLADAPNQIEISGLPDTLSANQHVVFTAKVVDPDNKLETSTSALTSAPAGATIDENGQISWTTPSEMLFSSQDYFFTFSSADEQNPSEASFTVTVNSPGSLPIARSGIEVPKKSNNILINDFDGDDKNEILTTDHFNRVMLITYNNGTPEQKWLYPYALPTEGRIKQVFAVNTDDDSEKEIYVLTENGLSVIDNLNSEARKLLTFEEDAVSGALEDTNNDGIPELAVFLTNEKHSNSTNTLAIYSLEKPQQPLFETNSDNAHTVRFGNVDTDENLELIVSSGLVYDTATWENEWLSGYSFGYNDIITADINGDGIEEIIGNNNGVTVYSVVDKAQIANLDSQYNNCQITAANLDNDVSDELIVGNCHWGKVHAYNFDSGNTFTEIWNVDVIDNDTVSTQVGDSDNDGKLELVWGAGVYHSGADELITADIDGESFSIRQDKIAPQLDRFVSAGWAKKAGNTEKAVFFVPRSNSGSGGGRIVQMDKNGQFTPSDEVSTNWNNDQSVITADFNNDGLSELLVPDTALYNTSLAIMDLSTYDISYQLPIDSNDALISVGAADVNGDNVADAIYSTHNYVKVVDVYNQSLISNFSVSDHLNDFSIAANSSVDMVVASNSLNLLTLTDGSFAKNDTIEKACMQVEYFNFDSDAALEVACLYQESIFYGGDTTSLIVYEINDGKFEQVHQKQLNVNVIDFVVSPVTESNQELILVTQGGGDEWDEPTHANIIFTDSFGSKISRSPDLLGSPSKDALKVRLDDKGKLNLLLSTSVAMYQIH